MFTRSRTGSAAGRLGLDGGRYVHTLWGAGVVMSRFVGVGILIGDCQVRYEFVDLLVSFCLGRSGCEFDVLFDPTTEVLQGVGSCFFLVGVRDVVN